MKNRAILGGVAAVLVTLGSVAEARQVVQPIGGERYPLAPAIRRGEGVAPFFDGYYTNDDGTYTYSFGFMNRNQEEILEIPIGPNNYITPEQFNGMQPTYFPPYNAPGGFGGRRERGAFAIRVPADFEGDVVWTLSVNGKTYSVPGRRNLTAYELGYTPQAAGSLMPAVKFAEDAPWYQGREGVVHGPLKAKVGQPLTIEFWAEDRGQRDPVAPRFRWWKHQAPVGSDVQFIVPQGEGITEERNEAGTYRLPVGGGKATTTFIFSMPGEYMLRVRVDNHTAPDSSHGNMCCWSNGYVRVTVEP